MMRRVLAAVVLASVAGLAPGLRGSFSKVQLVAATVPTTQDVLQSEGLQFVVSPLCPGAAATVLQEAKYRTFGTIHTGSEAFTLGIGAAQKLRALPEVFDVEVYDPCGALDFEHEISNEDHIVVAHFAASLKDIDRQLAHLASASEHVAKHYRGAVVACAFVCEDAEAKGNKMREDLRRLSGIAKESTIYITGHNTIPVAVEESAKETGVVIFFGDEFVLSAEIAKLEAEEIVATADLVKIKESLTTTQSALAKKDDALIAAEKELRALRAKLAEREASDDTSSAPEQ